MKRTRKYKATLVAAVVAGFAFLPQAYAADTAYETDTVKVEAEGVDKYLVTTNTITEQEIKDRGYRDLADILSQVPGLYMTYEGKDNKMVHIRAASEDQTKVYIDGIPAFPMNGIVSQSATDLSTIPADNIAKIEIIKGAGPVKYGTDYKGGVILVTTKDGKGMGKFRLSVAGGSHHTYDTRIGYSGNDKNISYAINASRYHTGGYLPNTVGNKTYFDGKIQVKTGKKDSLTLNGYYSNMDKEISMNVDPVTGQREQMKNVPFSVATGLGITGVMRRNNKATDWRYKGFKQANIAIQYESRPNDKWMYDVKYYHLIDENNFWIRNLLVSEGGTLPYFTSRAPQWYRSGWFSRGDGIEANASTALGDKHQLSFGAKDVKLNWHTDENNTSDRREGKDERRSFYIEDAWSFDSKTRMTIGIRHEHLSQSYADKRSSNPTPKTDSSSSATDPVLNITHDFSQKDTIRFSAGRSHVFIGAKDASSNIRADYPLPKPERDRNYEIGWKHVFSSKSIADLALFRTDVTNRIDSVFSHGDWVYVNINETHIRGIELSCRQTFSPKVSGFVNYTWLHAEDEDNGVTTSAMGIPSQMFNLGITYREGKLRSTLLGRAIRGFSNGVNSRTGVPYPKSSGYLAMDFDIRYEPYTDLGIFLRVNNIFNRDYQDKLYHPAQGINFLIGVDMTF
jgi:tonB-dependent receptor